MYCMFWELDDDHDGFISRFASAVDVFFYDSHPCLFFCRTDLAKYDRGAVTTRMIDRIIRRSQRSKASGGADACSNGSAVKAVVTTPRISYIDFCCASKATTKKSCC